MGQGSLPHSGLLSQALVAFTIEFDNAAETAGTAADCVPAASRGGVWLTFMAMVLHRGGYRDDS
jgi:hypothetical protein